MASFQPNADLSLGFLFLSFGILPAEGRPGLHCKWKNAKCGRESISPRASNGGAEIRNIFHAGEFGIAGLARC